MIRTLRFLSVTLLLALFAVSANAQKARYDVTGEGNVNSADVVAIYNYIISGEASGFTAKAANVNGDTDAGGNPIVNSADVVAVYNYIINGDEFDVYTVNGIDFAMVPVEGGTFEMGKGKYTVYDQGPVHSVTLSSYAIGQTEVTQALWTAVMGSNPSSITGDNRAVTSVSWEDCQEFIDKLNTQLADKLPEGKVFRLPTEAEWEFAAKGGNETRGYRYSGSDNIEDVAWYSGTGSMSPHEVGTKAANELGIYDMSGNVSEWCYDWFGDYTDNAQTNPTGPLSGNYRVKRGGGYLINSSTPGYFANNWRFSGEPSEKIADGGLRLVLAEPLDLPTTYTANGVTFGMVDVEGGTFQMGSEDGNDDEKPVHSVTLSGYAIGQTEVTQALWTAVMGSNPSGFAGDNLPVENVSALDSKSFISKLNALVKDQLPEGKVFRLPTEAEWEFAARGGNSSKGYTYSGGNTLDEVAWYKGNADSKTHAVGTKQPNELGIYDMSGNVYEWCVDWYDDYSSDAQTNPTGPLSGTSRATRGGGWRFDETYCRSACRMGTSNSVGFNFVGLRLVLGEPVDKPETFTYNGVSFTMVPVEGGTFRMGNSSSGIDDEKPVHSVTLSDYYIGQTEVTQALWKAVMGSNPSNFIGDNLPVEKVSWNDCETFMVRLTNLLKDQLPSNMTFRMPTEAEWEFAARGGNKHEGSMYNYSGSNTIGLVAWMFQNSNKTTHPVASKQPNELGIYDMTGNVQEWCEDAYGPYTSEAQTDPTGGSGSDRVIRGGSWNSSAIDSRSTYRYWNTWSATSEYVGVRIALCVKRF